MQNPSSATGEIESLEAAALRAARAGRDNEAIGLWNRVLEIDPNHVRTLSALGQAAFRSGDMQRARGVFQRIVDADGSDAQQWIHLAIACRNLKDEAAEQAAITRALSLDPRDLVALILRAGLLERQGKMHEAAAANSAVIDVAPPLDKLRPELRPAVAHALESAGAYSERRVAFLDEYLEPHYKAFAGEKLKRFRDSVDIMVGRKRRFDSQSLVYHYPSLAPIEFFDRADSPWLDAVEAATDAIRDEFLAVYTTEQGFTPYISYPSDVPHNQFAELNNSPRWSAFHLYKMGTRVDGNAARCPLTMQALANAPQPDQPGRTPSAMFSLLKPKTTIPVHTGVTNVRLVTHLPLIVPAGCRFRVGNDTREWIPGRAWVFDDTIEHEAVNDSDLVRVVLIFDVWHPHLSAAERAMVTALAAGIHAFAGGSTGDFDV